MIGDALALLGANACILLAGVGVLRLLTGAGPLGGPWARLGLAYVAGVASVGVLSTLLLIAGLGLTLLEILVLCGALFAVGFARRLRVEEGRRPLPIADRGLVLLSAGVVVAFLVLVGVDLAFQPLFRPDAWSQWTPKARSIVLFDGLDPQIFGNPIYTLMNVDYPLLVPALEAIAFRFMGVNTLLVHLQFWLLLAGFAAALVALLRERVAPALLWPVVAAIVVAPALAIQTAAAYADVPLAVFFALAGVCAWRWLVEGESGFLVLLGLFAAAALATKAEGLVYVGALFAVLLPLVARRSRRHAGLTFLVGAAALVGIVPWRAWIRAHDVPGIFSLRNAFSPDFLLSHGERIPTVLWALFRDVLDPTAWLALVPLAAASAVLAVRHASRLDGVALVLGTFVLAFCGLVWIYWSTPFTLEQHLAVSSNRVVVGPVLFLAALTPLLLAQALEGHRLARVAQARSLWRADEEGLASDGAVMPEPVADGDAPPATVPESV